MVSKNNMMLLENKQNRKNMRYGIRKFSSGTASVLLGFTVAGTVMMMANHEEASADTVGTQSNTNSVSSTIQNASVPIQSPKSQDVQNAVNNAVNQGVQVTQNNSQTIVAHNTTEVQQAQQQVSQANQQQADKINAVAQQQKQLNDQYAKDKAEYDTWQANTKDATTVNKQNSDKLQAAVQAAKAAGVQVTQNQTQTLTATNSTYNSVKQDVNDKYNQQVSSLNSITDAQKDLNNRYNNAKSDAQNLNSDSNSTRNSLDSAIRNAQSTNGVKLIDDGTRNVTVDVNNYAAKKAEIERDNKQQADSINSQVQQYKDEYANWEKSNKQFLEKAAAKTDWSVQQVLNFLGKNLPNVSYVSAGSNMTFDKGTLQSFNQSELSSILSNPKVDPGLKNYLSSKAYGSLYKLAQGTTWKYNNAFTDTKSGKSVDLKVTVQGLGLNYSGRYGLPPMIMVGEKYIGSDVAGIGAVKYGLTFLEHGTNTPINITSLIGIGDVDAKQSVAVYNAVSALRGSENKDYSGAGYLGSINTNGVDDFSEGKNTQYQSWFLVPNSSTVSYVFSAADPAWGNSAPDGSGFMGFYHQNLGGIPLPIKSTPITPPTLHYHHINVALQPSTPLKANYTEYEISTKTKVTPEPPKLKHLLTSYTNYNIVYQTTSDKNWKEGSQTVNGKLEINDDVAHAKVDMTVPSPSTVDGKLTHVSLTDNYSKFAKFVTVTGANIYENKRNATADYTITNANNAVTATRKNPAEVNGGTVSLVVDFKVNPDVPTGTKLVNSGSGTINTQTVPTPDAQIVTFTQKPTKHWIEGSQVVDGKTYINDDIVTTKVDMDLPDPKQLAKTLSYVSVIDDYRDFKDKAVLQSYKMLENGTDVTSQYTVTNNAGLLQAVRKNAATTPGGKVSLIATFEVNHDVKSGTAFTNRGSGRINNHTVDTNTPQIITFKQDTSKHWVEGSQVVDDKTYINEDMVHGQVTMTLPNKDSLAKALTDVTLVDDYSDYANKASYVNAQVFENGTDVTSQYTITNAGNKITATRKSPGATPSGSVRLVANFKLNSNLPSGTKLINRGSGRINNNTVNTNEAKILTYVQSTDKHWVEGNQNVDGKIYVNGSTAHAQVSMTLPDQSKLVNKLSNVSIDDDYSKFAKLVDYKSAKVLENGKDVTSEYAIKNANGHVTAVRKDTSKTPAGNVQLLVDFEIHKDVKPGTELVNGGSGTLNKNTVPTNTPSIWTYTPDGEKHWVLDNNVTDNKIYFSGDKAVAQVSVDLPDASKLATPLNKLVLVDNYSDFADKVKLDSAKVLENGKDVTSEYDLTNKDGKVAATRKDAAKTPSGKAVLVTTFTINNGIENATALHNKGSVTVDSITDEVPDTPIVVFTPKAHKDVELGGDVKGDTENSVDSSLILNGSVVTYPITTSDLPAERAEDITKRVVKDTLDKNAEFVGFKAWIENDKGELEDVTSHYKLDKNGQNLIFTEDSYLLGLYNKDKSKQTHTPIIDLVVKVKGNAQKITNKATVLTNDNVTETNEVSVDTPAKPTPTKVDKNEKGVNIDGKNVLPGSVNNYELTMDLAKFKGIKVTEQDLAKGFYFVDDYPEEALDVDPQTFTYKTVDGKTVKGLSAKVYQSLSEVPENVATALKANGITPSGAFVLISADDPAQFFKDYVETGTNIIVNAPMKVKEGFAGKYQNKAWQLTFGQGEATDVVSNNVPKIDPKKDIVISADNRTSLNNHTIELGQNFDYLLKGGILDKDQGHDIYEYKWVDDYDENHDQYNGQFIAPLTVDVTLKDGTVLKTGTDISNHVSQNIDTKTGSVEFSVDKDFLDKVDFDKGGFAADILMSVKRIKAGEVDNTYTNVINGQKFGSNTVHSTTPEPKDPETPATPKTPETPSVPVVQTQTPATPQPVKMVTSTPAPKAPESPALPQMGDESDSKATAVGLALLGIGLVGMAAIPLDRKRYGLERSSKEK
ncbi:SspB-related isopeptide-forming adhesin [Ligilactobacillus salivarius]|uniref:SspB-related isopeptide-forming adhesin n=1 Tax=Ligilactobacillus salivarius TaxID=1624 RepID=UPI0009D9493E|nr:SspB-related isopeptide-forming adhesin [Ligilactobacillus salivarius]OQR18999.1 hypothetical protein B6U39_09145 [Ligilactobacillus salivarius]